MDFFEIGDVIRRWLVAQPWLSFAHDWAAAAPAWQIFGALTAPIVILLLAFVLLLMRSGSRGSNGSSETVEVLKQSDPAIEQTNDPVGVQSPITSNSPESSTVAAEILSEPSPSTPASELDPTVSSTEQNAVASESTAEPTPSTSASEVDQTVSSTEQNTVSSESTAEPTPSTSASEVDQTVSSTEQNTVASEATADPTLSTSASEVDQTVGSTEQNTFASEATAEPSPSPPVSRID
jgi:hypothetical protein